MASCVDPDSVYGLCLPSEITGELIHGLECPLWVCRCRPGFDPFTGLPPMWRVNAAPVVAAPVVVPPVPVPVCESVYELTITSTEDDPYYIRGVLAKIIDSAMFEVKAYIAVLELTKAGLPHIHAMLYSNKKYLDASKVKKFCKYRFELKRVRSHEHYLNYIKKDIGNNIVSDYCIAKGIPQVWYSDGGIFVPDQLGLPVLPDLGQAVN